MARLRIVFSSSGRLVMERIKQVCCLAVSNLRVIDGLGSTLLELLPMEVKNRLALRSKLPGCLWIAKT